MLCEEAPACLCGSKNWSPGGASIGGISQQFMQCKDCGRYVMFIHAYSNGCAIQNVDPPTADDGEQDFKPFVSWLNDVLLVTFRAQGELIEAARQEVATKAFEVACVKRDYPSTTTWKDLPEDVLKEIQDEIYPVYSSPEYRRPSGFEPPIPPNIPDKMHFRLMMNDSSYRHVLQSESLGLELPPDPTRVHHDAYYLPILAELGITDFTLIPNEYCGAKNQPWYSFEVQGSKFKVGPRKRVTNIEVVAPQPIPLEAIAAVAKADDTTYYVEGDWHPFDVVAGREVCIHAWSAEKVKEYLKILIAAVNG